MHRENTASTHTPNPDIVDREERPEGAERASIEKEPNGISRARFLGLGAAGSVGALLASGMGTWGAESVLARPQDGKGGLYNEHFRPQFHFSPKKNWMNDPNGMVYYKGEYHLFFQHNPYGDTWGNMSWGHAVSRDMLYWEQLPIALFPDELGLIFSGSAVVDENDTSGFFDGGEGLVAIYTNAGETQVQSIAYSTDRGRTWTKYEGNPVIENPGIVDFRDPKVFWHEGTSRWVMALAAGDRIIFYSSENLIDWNKLSEFGADQGAHGGVWECPELFELPVGDTGRSRWVLQVDINPGSANGGSGGQYFIGGFDGQTFTNDNPPDTVLWVDWGKDFYATQAWNNIPEQDGRRLWLAWMNNWQYANEIPTDPWRSSDSLPREITLTDTADGVRLVQQPVRELQRLRNRRYRRTDVIVDEAGAELGRGRRGNGKPPIDGQTMEIVAEFDAWDAREVGFRVRQGEDGQQTVIGYNFDAGLLFVDRRWSGITGFSEHFPGFHEAPMSADNGRVRMHLFVDRSSVEVFADEGKTVITERIFPRGESEDFEPYAKGGRALLPSLEVYDLASTWR